MGFTFSKLQQTIAISNSNTARQIVYDADRNTKRDKKCTGEETIRPTYFQVIKN